jgi:DNA-binding response OmpR family regulator
MSELFLLTNAAEPAVEIMPALGLLLHTVRTGPADMIAFEDATAADVILVDARRDLIGARQLCQLLRRSAPQAPVLALMTEGGLAAVTAEWGTDDVVLSSAGPAEVEARLRLAIGRQANAAPAAPDEIRSGELSIDEATYTARLRARVLDLTFKEFELLKFLAQHPGRVFTRAHLLQEVWGYDYFGGTRTVDVHVRRLRAKLGSEHEALIGTVRNVGYRFVPLKSAGEDGRRGSHRDGPRHDGPVPDGPMPDGGTARAEPPAAGKPAVAGEPATGELATGQLPGAGLAGAGLAGTGRPGAVRPGAGRADSRRSGGRPAVANGRGADPAAASPVTGHAQVPGTAREG